MGSPFLVCGISKCLCHLCNTELLILLTYLYTERLHQLKPPTLYFFTPLLQLEAINLNYKNKIVTTILENIHLAHELLISGIVYQITLWRLTIQYDTI